MAHPLAYNQNLAMIPDTCIHKISPSRFANFIERPHEWFRTEILGEEGFTHNTSSVIGTCVHYCAEQVAKGKEVDKEIISEYVLSLDPNENYDPHTVLDSYGAMAEELVNSYVLPNQSSYMEIEQFKIAEILRNYYIGGTLDVIQGEQDDCMITDYKTYHSKTKPKVIPRGYKYQLLVYAYLLWKLGYSVSRIRLVYVNRYIDGGLSEKTGKPLKSYPPEVTVLTESIDEGDFEFIESVLTLCIETCEASTEYPELQHVIWHDQRLKLENT